jgi:hypothetical protein
MKKTAVESFLVGLALLLMPAVSGFAGEVFAAEAGEMPKEVQEAIKEDDAALQQDMEVQKKIDELEREKKRKMKEVELKRLQDQINKMDATANSSGAKEVPVQPVVTTIPLTSTGPRMMGESPSKTAPKAAIAYHLHSTLGIDSNSICYMTVNGMQDHYRIGSHLPEGYVVASIQKDSVEIKKDEALVTLYLNQPATVEIARPAPEEPAPSASLEKQEAPVPAESMEPSIEPSSIKQIPVQEDLAPTPEEQSSLGIQEIPTHKTIEVKDEPAVTVPEPQPVSDIDTTKKIETEDEESLSDIINKGDLPKDK